MQTGTITIVGGGNLGGAIAEGLIDHGGVAPDRVSVTRRRTERIAHLAQRGIRVTSDNRSAVQGADVVLVAVEPSQCRAVLEELAPVLQPESQVLASTVAGVSLAEMTAVLGQHLPVLRVMPNTSVAIGCSLTCVAAGEAPPPARERIATLFEALGRVVFLEEELMQAATVLGACGVAFAMRFVRAASQGGIEIGFDAETAQLIAAQTVLGAASLLLARGHHPEREIDRVTTPQGCTIAGLNEMEHQGFSSALIKGITTSFDKIARVADERRR